MNEITLSDLGAETPFPEVEAQLDSATIDTTDYELEVPSNHYSPGVTTGLEEKAMNLLGSGIVAESVASALGVTSGRIAQLLSNEVFSEQVSKLRYISLQSHNIRDNKYDRLEDKLIKKLKDSLPLMVKPSDILNAVKIVNNAKRRGQSAPQQITNQQNIINLTLPTIIAEKFAIDINNQVVKAGEQELLTMPSGNLLKQVEEAEQERQERLTHVQEESN